MSNTVINKRLSLMPGEVVEVRTAEEILSTLDEDGCLDQLPFMPEMLQYCGRRFAVYRRADKTCDTATRTGGRRQYDTVHLEGLRCDGAAHGGCQAACLLFWKEGWLKRAGEPAAEGGDVPAPGLTRIESFCTRNGGNGEETIYRCQATTLPEYTTPLNWWDVRQYVRDLQTGNTSLGNFVRVMSLAAFRALLRLGIGSRWLLSGYNTLQRIRGGRPYPSVGGVQNSTPVQELDLRPGEQVRVKDLDEINATLDRQSKNRGMRFDPEMARFCGGTYRVAKRVDMIINEATGQMMHFGTPAIILEDVFCRSELSSCRLFCPRSIYSYWREIWLERVQAPPDHAAEDGKQR